MASLLLIAEVASSQWDFAAFAAVLLGLLVWFFKTVFGRLVSVITNNNQVISNNTAAIESLRADGVATRAEVKAVRTVVEDVRDRLLARPCLRDEAFTPPGRKEKSP